MANLSVVFYGFTGENDGHRCISYRIVSVEDITRTGYINRFKFEGVVFMRNNPDIKEVYVVNNRREYCDDWNRALRTTDHAVWYEFYDYVKCTGLKVC